MSLELKLKRFDMSSIDCEWGSVIFIIGRRDTGKSVLVRDFLNHNTDISRGTVISGTEEEKLKNPKVFQAERFPETGNALNNFYENLAPTPTIHKEYNTEIIENIMRKNSKQYRKCEKLGVETKKSFVILDDCLYDNSWTREKPLRQLFMNGRNQKITLLITMGYPLGIPPCLRSNIDYIFILRESYLTNKKRIYDNYVFDIFPTFELFCQVMDTCTTEDYECLVINNCVKSDKIEYKVFWYKVDLDYTVDKPEFEKDEKEAILNKELEVLQKELEILRLNTKTT